MGIIESTRNLGFTDISVSSKIKMKEIWSKIYNLEHDNKHKTFDERMAVVDLRQDMWRVFKIEEIQKRLITDNFSQESQEYASTWMNEINNSNTPTWNGDFIEN